MEKAWQTYEKVARTLLDRFASDFKLDKVEGKQKVQGKRSGTKWEIDAKGVRNGGQDFVIIECRRYKTSKQSQERLAGLAYRIIDTGAQGGIVVSQLGLQEGARLIAAAENVVDVYLDPNSTIHEYFMMSADQVYAGDVVSLDMSDSLRIIELDKQGNVVRTLLSDK
jgi:hypothetical protein